MLQFGHRNSVFIAACACIVSAAACVAAPSASEVQGADQETAQGWTLDLKKGQVLQVVVPEERPEGRDARQSYYQNAFPIAETFGYNNEGQLSIRDKVRSEYDPSVIAFFSWPDTVATQAYRSSPQFPAFKELRREAWHEMKIYDSELTEDLQLTFDPGKHYTAWIAWFDPEDRSDYTLYLEGIEPAVERAGGRIVYQMRDILIQTFDADENAPGQITFVEWQTADGFARVQQSPEFLANQVYYDSAVNTYEFYWLKAGT